MTRCVAVRSLWAFVSAALLQANQIFNRRTTMSRLERWLLHSSCQCRPLLSPAPRI
jgi:hypothetical protein